jgi:lipoprotein-anchoring transpeptidase ErfK/SrfK
VSDDRDLTTALRDVADAHQTPPQVPGTEIRRRAAWRRRRRHGALAATAAAAVVAAVVLGLTTGLGGGTDRPPAVAASGTVPSTRAAATVDLSRRLLMIAGRELPVSSGTAQHPTPTGLMTVTAKFPTKAMDSAALGLGDGYDLTLPWVVELRTADGRTNYVVALTYDEKAPGKRDVTHGWIGLRTADAKWLYAKVKPGMVLSVG